MRFELCVAASSDRSNFQRDLCIGFWCNVRMCAIALGMSMYFRFGNSVSISSGRQ